MDILAVIPTYNESGNIKQVVSEILALPLNIEVLVVDDLSPDGTYKIVEEMAESDKRVHLLLRKENRGRGWAGIDGFKKALEMGAKYIVEMDGDGSHAPKYIPAFVANAQDGGMVIGSRYVAGGKDESRTLLRRMISGFARRYLSFAIGVKIADPTSGFRLYEKSALQKITGSLSARDPFIVAEVLFYAKKNKIATKEVPIEFMPRIAGESKLQALTLLKYLFRALLLRFK
jgi:dolichol-phosphate mannosyltransferase